jgi:hypothetical protein
LVKYVGCTGLLLHAISTATTAKAVIILFIKN